MSFAQPLEHLASYFYQLKSGNQVITLCLTVTLTLFLCPWGDTGQNDSSFLSLSLSHTRTHTQALTHAHTHPHTNTHTHTTTPTFHHLSHFSFAILRPSQGFDGRSFVICPGIASNHISIIQFLFPLLLPFTSFQSSCCLIFLSVSLRHYREYYREGFTMKKRLNVATNKSASKA